MLCNNNVDPDTYWPNRDCGSVDHVVPVVEGGTDDKENLQLAHLRCNLAKEATRRSEKGLPTGQRA